MSDNSTAGTARDTSRSSTHCVVAIESSSDPASIAVMIDHSVVEEVLLTDFRRHNEYVLPALDALLRRHSLLPADVNAIAFGRGPGSFTGSRLAASVAHGLHAALAVPLWGVNSLHALAFEVVRSTGIQAVAVAMDARMGQAYLQRFVQEPHDRFPNAADEPQLVDVTNLQLPDGFIAAGNAWPPTTIAHVHGPAVVPHAAQVAQLAVLLYGAGSPAPAAAFDELYPIYVRGADAWTSGQKHKHG